MRRLLHQLVYLLAGPGFLVRVMVFRLFPEPGVCRIGFPDKVGSAVLINRLIPNLFLSWGRRNGRHHYSRIEGKDTDGQKTWRGEER